MAKQFERIVGEAHEIWSSAPRDRKQAASAEALKYYHLADRPGANFHVVDLQATSPDRFRLNNLIERTDQRRDGVTHLGDYPDTDFIKNHVAPAYEQAKQNNEPIVDEVQAQMRERFIVYDRLILPQKTKHGPSAWALGLVFPRLILPVCANPPPLSKREQQTLDLILLGLPPREIAVRLDLSQRTIEHRILDLRAKFGAESITHLVTLAVAARFLGKIAS